MANSSGRFYGTKENLLCEFLLLKERFNELKEKEELSKWLTIFKNKEYYSTINNILHFALCCFMKIPLEATAETIGSVINRHGCKERCGLLPSSLSNEVQLVWKGPAEFHPDTHN